MDSAIPGFFKKSQRERLDILKRFCSLSDEEVGLLVQSSGGITFEGAEKMIENAVGTFALPLGVATNFRINGADRLVPMVTEEPSVVAAASKGAKAARPHGGFTATAGRSYSIGQIQVLDANHGAKAVAAAAERILKRANEQSRTLSKLGKGALEVSCREVQTDCKRMLLVELLVDAGDAMGANVTNTMCEAVAPLVEEATGGRVLLRILSNYATRRMVRASAVFARKELGGSRAVDGMVDAYQLAKHDVYRAVTHNKGVMNGMVGVAAATGQDSRAIEAAAHAYASRSGRYSSLTEWAVDDNGNLVGTLEVPMAVGTVGGITNVHPLAKTCIKILGAASASELACAVVAAGLAQNCSALRALATEGIQRGHMRLHARNLAAAAGVPPGMIDGIVDRMVSEGRISLGRAKDLAGQG